MLVPVPIPHNHSSTVRPRALTILSRFHKAHCRRNTLSKHPFESAADPSSRTTGPGGGMIEWSVDRRSGCRSARRRALMLCGCLWAGLVSNAAAMAPRYGHTGLAREISPGDRDRPDYEAYVVARGAVLPGLRRHALAVHEAAAIPPFARKYGLPCSACHTAWPELNAFGQRFKDNGYQLGNDRDSPIWQNNAYWPIAMRTTPQIHVENTTHQPTDAGEKTLTQGGFDLSGVDFLMLGTLYKDITFGLVPTLDADGTTGLEAAFVRFDNLGHSPWANVKVGKFELDNLLSEKRFTWLSANGGQLYAYHYLPVGSTNNFGFGDNQIGAEFSGHSLNSYTRYSVALLTTDDGEPGLPGGKSVDAMFTASRAFAMGSGLGPQRIGVFGYLGHRPTTFELSGGNPIPGTGSDNKSFVRLGATAQLWMGNLELIPLFAH